MQIILPDAASTLQLGEGLSRTCVCPAILLLDGDLGAGKTTCVQGIARVAGITGPVTSPTFALIQEYPEGDPALVHIDLYRLAPEAVRELWLEEFWERQVLVAIEWAERLRYLPEDYLRLQLQFRDPEGRRAVFKATGPQSAAWLARLAEHYTELEQ